VGGKKTKTTEQRNKCVVDLPDFIHCECLPARSVTPLRFLFFAGLLFWLRRRWRRRHRPNLYGLVEHVSLQSNIITIIISGAFIMCYYCYYTILLYIIPGWRPNFFESHLELIYSYWPITIIKLAIVVSVQL